MRRWTCIVWSATALFALVFFWVGAIRYRAFRAGVDEGVFMQVISSALTGFRSTTEGNLNHFAVHFSPILFLLAPPIWITHSTLALIAIQGVALSLVGPPIFLIARNRMPDGLAAAVMAVSLAYPPLVALASGDFSELLFAPPATLWLLWAVDARRWRLAAAFAAIALAIKEDELIILAVLAVALVMVAARRHDAALGWFGGILCTSSLLLLYLYFFVWQPAVANGVPYWSFHFYDWGSTRANQLGMAPIDSQVRLWYVVWALLPLGGICLLSPVMLLALPGFAEVMFSHEAIVINLSTHYLATWLPYVLVSYSLGVAFICARALQVAKLAVAICAFATVCTDLYANPSSLYHRPFEFPSAHTDAIDRVISKLAPNSSVGTSLNIYAHLGLDPAATINLSSSKYLLIDRKCTADDCRTQTLRPADLNLRTRCYHLIYALDGVELYERCEVRSLGGHPK